MTPAEELASDRLLAAYVAGYFPMPARLDGDRINWYSPDPRGVLPVDGLRVSRSLRRSVRRYRTTINQDFTAVLDGCADPSREGRWIDRHIRSAYLELHRLGWCHSIEVWSGTELVGGLYGVAIGGLFAGESMYSGATDASKVALVRLIEELSDAHASDRLIDTQWSTDHLASLGVVEVSRAEYLDRLDRALLLPPPAAFSQSVLP